jgi:hypothetical protein
MINLFCVRPRRFNVGNATIDAAMSAVLRDVFGERCNLVPIPAIASDEEGSLSGLTAKTVYEMNLYGHGVVVGGGNLYENGQLDVDVNALCALAAPLLLCSLSHGRIYDRRGRLTRRTDSMPVEHIVALHGRASASLARDDATCAHLHELGLTAARLGGCPTLFVDELLSPSPPPRAAPGALISIRNPQLMSMPHVHQARVHDQVRLIADALEQEGFGPVRLLCHDKRDLGFASSFGDLEYVLPDDVWGYLGLLRAAPVVVTFRLHAFLPCLSFGTPAVNISYDERSLSLVRTVGLGDWDIDLVKEHDAVEAVRDRLLRIEQLSTLVDDARPAWAQLRSTMRTTLEEFRERVDAYAAQAAPEPA